MKALIALVIAALPTIAACGIDTKKANSDLQSLDDGSKTQSAPAATDASQRGNTQAQDGTTISATTTTSTTVTASVPSCSASQAPAASTDTVTGSVFSPALVSWKDAIANAPDGKRLATRAEALALFDAGKLRKISSPLPAVWTATASNGAEAWILGVMDGSLTADSKTAELPAIYVDIH